MKPILLLIGAVTLFSTTGCIFVGHRDHEEYREHGGYREHEEYPGHVEHHAYSEPGVDVRIHN